MKEITTIKINIKTKERLNKLRAHKRESYDELVQKALGILNTCLIDPAVAREKLRRIERESRRL